jgi:hypothetical protein
MELETMNHCAGEAQQQFSSKSIEPVMSCIANSRYLTTTSEQTEACRLVRVSQLFAITNYKHSINPIINPNPVSNH